jgi:two-component system, NtrC family, sensor kinase
MAPDNPQTPALPTKDDFNDKKQTHFLSDEKQFYSRIIQNAASALFVINTSHTILFWNNALAKLTGKSSFQMKNTKRHWSAFYYAQCPLLADLLIDRKLPDGNRVHSSRKISQSAEGVLRTEGWFDNVGGKRRYLLFEATPIINSDSEIIAAIETIQDITESKHAQEVMDNQSRFFQEILEAIPNPVFYKDISHAYIGCNKAFSAFFGRTAEEIPGKTISDITPEELAQESGDADRKIIETHSHVNYETRLLRNDGQIRTVLVTKAPFTDSAGLLCGIVGTFVDVTEQRLMDEQVKKAKREWEETLDSLKDFVILTDAQHRVRRCNRLLCDMTGKEYDEVIDKDWRDLLPDAGFEEVSFNGTSGELVHIASQRYYDLNIYNMTEPDSEQINGFVISLNDTTEIRSMTAELQRTAHELNEAQRAVYQQEKLASIGQLAAGVAHEINNPMGFISSNLATMGKYMDKLNAFETAMIEIAENRGAPETIAELKELRRKMKIDFILGDIHGLLEESRDGAERVRRIVQDLKSFSHVDEAECKPASINDCLNSTLNMARNEIKYVADVELEYDAGLPMLNCHPQQLNQVFMNLLVNAAHAIEGHGSIRIRTFREEEDIVIQVNDTGKGIAPEHLTRVFEPFFTTKEVGKGTGLGLSISYDIVKKHGGSISVESNVGKGSTFTVRLPLNQPLANDNKIS